MGADLNVGSADRASSPTATSYGALATRFYDADKPIAGVAELDWYRKRLPRDAGPVLEAMAGSGRLLLPLAAAGYRMHGVDTSESMLASCAARLRHAGREAPLFRQNIAALNLPFRYSAAFVAAGSLQLLTARDQLRDALACLRAHLVDPAVLLLDLFVPDAALHPPGAPIVEFRNVALADGSQVMHRCETAADAKHRRILCMSRYERRVAGQIVERDDETVVFTWHGEDEMTALLRDAGYREVRIEPPAWPRGDGHSYGVSARA
ncbi:MAG: class I SAM-dependent methyltransferase [Betaproteobacteria bacterium]